MFIKNRDELTAHGDREGRRLALDILEAGLIEADPYRNVRSLIRIEDNRLLIGGYPEKDVSGYGDEVIDLSTVEHIYVLGAGKAVQRQAEALEDLLGDRLTGGAIIVKQGEGCHLQRIDVTEGAHPIPDENSVIGAQKIVEIARRAGKDDLVFTLFSDGASSLFTLPAPGLSLADIRQVYALAIKYGTQRLIHRVMPYLSAVKAGRIAALIDPARSVNLVMQVGLFPRWRGKLPSVESWVPNWPPAYPPRAAALAGLQAEPWWDELTPAVRQALERGAADYELPPLDQWSEMRCSFYQPIDLYQMVEGARRKAEEMGFKGVVLASHLAAYSSAAATVLAHIAHEIEQFDRPFAPPVALITGGHLDVPVGDATGVGGRNQEFALCWGQILGQGLLASKRIVVAALDSDGTEGTGTRRLDEHGAPTGEVICMAGGVADGYTLQEAAELGVDVAGQLRNHNSTMALMKLGSAIHTGNTGMALGDLRVAIVR